MGGTWLDTERGRMREEEAEECGRNKNIPWCAAKQSGTKLFLHMRTHPALARARTRTRTRPIFKPSVVQRLNKFEYLAQDKRCREDRFVLKTPRGCMWNISLRRAEQMGLTAIQHGRIAHLSGRQGLCMRAFVHVVRRDKRWFVHPAPVWNSEGWTGCANPLLSTSFSVQAYEGVSSIVIHRRTHRLYIKILDIKSQVVLLPSSQMQPNYLGLEVN